MGLDPVVMTQILLAVVGAISVWALKAVIDQGKQITELKGVSAGLKGEIDATKNTMLADKSHLNYRLDRIEGATERLDKKFDRLVDRRQPDMSHNERHSANPMDT